MNTIESLKKYIKNNNVLLKYEGHENILIELLALENGWQIPCPSKYYLHKLLGNIKCAGCKRNLVQPMEITTPWLSPGKRIYHQYCAKKRLRIKFARHLNSVSEGYHLDYK